MDTHSTIGQLVVAIVIIFGIILIITTADTIWTWAERISDQSVDLIPNTVSAQSQMIRLQQDPSVQGAVTLPRSNNERDGLEFTYAFWIFIDPATFSGTSLTPTPSGQVPTTLRHVFHKGTSTMFPLLAPGVFINQASNELVIFMNTFDKWNNVSIVRNMPVQKWVHIVISVRQSAMDVYLNGNVVLHEVFTTLPKQNYSDVFFFVPQAVRLGPNRAPFPVGVPPYSPPPTTTLNCWSARDASKTSSEQAAEIDQIYPYVNGAFSGNLSRAKYYSYALSYGEIAGLVKQGPSSKVDNATQDQPPYLADNWWINSFSMPVVAS